MVFMYDVRILCGFRWWWHDCRLATVSVLIYSSWGINKNSNNNRMMSKIRNKPENDSVLRVWKSRKNKKAPGKLAYNKNHNDTSDEWRYIYKVRELLVHFESTQSMMMMANSIRNAHNAHTRIAGVMQSHIWNWNWWGWTTTTKTTKIGKKWEKLVNAFARWEWKSAPPIKQQGRDDPEGGGRTNSIRPLLHTFSHLCVMLALLATANICLRPIVQWWTNHAALVC